MIRVCLVLVLMMIAGASGDAVAQTRIVAVVNGNAITSYDVSERQKLLRLTGQRGNLREAALDELINETIQDIAVKKARITVTDGDIESAVGDIAKRAKISTAQLKSALRQGGVSYGTLTSRIKSQIGFARLIRARFQSLAKVTEQDLVAALRRDEEAEKSVDTSRYDLHQVIIALPDDPSTQRLARANARAKEVRSRFTSCGEGIPMAKKTMNVVVRHLGNRLEIEFPQDVQEKLAATDVGRLTEPFPQRRGLVMLAVCKKETVRSSNAAMKKLEPGIANERGQAFSKQYLRQLKRDAVIERRG